MKKILVILPKSVVGGFIMEGFANGFELNKCRVIRKMVDELTSEELEKFKPDMILGYGYSFLADENCTQIIKTSDCKNIVCYFADEPEKEYLLGNKTNLYNELKKIKPRVFIWDKDFSNEFKKSIYLPLAVNPKKYMTDFSGYKYSISFVGSPLGDICQKILCELVTVFKNKLNIFADEKIFSQSLNEIKTKGLLDEGDLEIYSNCRHEFIEKEEELAKIYNSSKINLNITLQGKSSINYRVFEVLASGGFLLTDERADLGKYFEISKHLETYKNTDDLIDKINFYLNNLNIAQKMAQLGKFEVIENHTFSARARIILENISL